MVVQRSRGILVVSVLMLVFGFAEVVTAFRHAFFGLSTVATAGSTLLGAAIGVLYMAGGALVLSTRRTALIAALLCLGLDVIGRLAMVALGFFPTDTLLQTVGSAVGTLIAVGFGAYLWNQRSRYA